MSDYIATPSVELPAGWNFNDLGAFVTSWAVGPRFPGSEYDDEGTIATLRTTDMDDDGNINLATMPLASLSPKLFEPHFLRNNDLVISRSGTCGVTAVFPGYHLPVVPGAFLLRFRFTPEIEPVFLRYFFNSANGRNRLLREAEGGVQKNIRGTSVLRIAVSLPPKLEQRKIARILTTVDKLIETTEALIAKYQATKQGMMHDLFTRGVDEHGNLRPRHEEAPELYKQSELGWIPKKWEVERLVNRITLPQGQVDPRHLPYRDWILVAPDHVEQRTGRLLARQTAAEQGAISGKYEFSEGDIVYSKIRPYLRKAVLAKEHGICSADMYPLRPLLSVRPRYLLGIVLGEHFSRFAEAVSERSGFPKINRSELAEYHAAFPSLEEQDRICRVIELHEKQTGQEQVLLAKYKRQKAGLMQDLLTGKIRVKVDETEEVAAHA